MDYREHIQAYITLEKDILSRLDVDAINKAMLLLDEAFENESIIYIFGNGGSAATASHFQNDFNRGISRHTKKKFMFNCLNDSVSTLMAIANDIGYDEVFRLQLQGRLKPDDLVIAISGSGNSENILNAVEYAKKTSCKVIALTGYSGGKLRQMCDVSLHVPVNSMQITEDLHMVLDHLIMAVYYKTKCGIDHCAE